MTGLRAMIPDSIGLKVGDWVEVRSRDEILSTLDGHARLDELPFMPQMLQFCGRRLQVRKRAHKLCDTVHGTGGRKMTNAVFLDDIRCDGAAFGGCEMRCLILWKEAWLKRVDSVGSSETVSGGHTEPVAGHGCRLEDVFAGTRVRPPDMEDPDPPYVCQATQLPSATTRLSRWEIGQYIEDYRSGNARIGEIVGGLLFILYENLVSSGLGMGAALRWLYDAVQRVRGGSAYPSRMGLLPPGGRTPSVDLGLQVGDLVRVKDHAQILETVDEQLRNRGMSFHPVMVPHCGKTFRVLQRAGVIMDEKTGRLMRLKNQCLVLDGADCLGSYTNPILCPRSCYPYWREIWLERVESGAAGTLEAVSPHSQQQAVP